MPQVERQKTFTRKQRSSKKAIILDDLGSNRIPCSSSQDGTQEKATTAESEADPYVFEDMHADKGNCLDHTRRRTGRTGIKEAPLPDESHPIDNDKKPSVRMRLQHDPAFLQKLVAAQRECSSAWSSEDSSSSDDEGKEEPSPTEPAWVPTHQHSKRVGPAKKSQSHQMLGEAGANPTVASQAGSDQLGVAPSIPKSSQPSQDTNRTVPKVPALQPPAASSAASLGGSQPSLSRGPAQEAARKRKEASQDMEVDVQPKTRPRMIGPDTPLTLGTSLLVNVARQNSQETDMDSAAAATSVMEAQESGEQFEIQDNVVYALDGLTSSASQAVRQESAAKIAEVCASRRGRLALRADGLIQDVMAAGSKLPLAQDPVLAVAFSAMLLAFSREKLHQAVLAQKDSLTVLGMLLEAHANADFRTCKAKSACDALARMLRESPLMARLPQSERACPSSLALAALAGATDPQQSSTASEALKARLQEGGILQRLANLATHHAKGLASSTNRSAARSLWGLNQCLVAIEHATFACAANEQHLVATTLQRTDAAEPLPSKPLQSGTRSASQPAAVSCEPDGGTLPNTKSSSQRSFSSSPPHRELAIMRCGSESQAPEQCDEVQQHSSSGSMKSAGSAPSAYASTQEVTFPAWLVRQAQSLAPADKGVPGRGLCRDALQRMLSVLMNLTHNNGPGCAAILGADGLQTVIGLIDALLGPPEEEAIFVRIADRRRLLEGLDLTSTALGLLINLVEHDSGCRPSLAAIPLRHGTRALPLLCRLMQASGAVPEEPVASLKGSPGLEVTEEQLLAREEEGAVSIVEVYAALVLGFIIENDPALRQEVECSLEGGVSAVTMAVQRCLQFYVNAGAITRSTEESLRGLLASLQTHS